MILHHIPDYCLAYSEVLVRKDVSHRNNLSPVNFRHGGILGLRQLSSRFADHFKVSDNCIHSLTVSGELLKGDVCKIGLYGLDGVNNIREI